MQVSLVALNTYQLANREWVGALIVGFMISLAWTFNVRRAAFGSFIDRLIYASGAMAGTATGLIAAGIFYS